MIPWSVAWKNVWTRPGRTLLTMLSVAIGVSSIVAVLQATISTRARLTDINKAVAAKAPLNVVAVDGNTFPEEVVETVRAARGVKAAIPTFGPITLLYHDKQKVQGMVVGVDLDEYRLVRDLEIVSGRKYQGPSEICLEAGAARALGLQPGDEVELQTRLAVRPVKHTVVGIVEMRGVSALAENAVAFFPLSAAQRSWRRPNQVSAIHIVVDESSNPDEVSGNLSQVLPKSLAVRKASAVAGLERETETLVSQSLNVAAALSVIAAIFIVLNTFMMNVAERQRQFALLRVVGATVEQIRNLMFQESLLLSLLGTAIGVACGMLGGYLLSRGIQQIFGIELPTLPTRILPVIAGVVFGPLITVIAIIYPALKASRVPPLAILKDAPPLIPNSRLRQLLWLGLGGLVLSAVLYAMAFTNYIKPAATIPALTVGLLACVFVTPVMLKPISYLLYSAQPYSLSLEANLARVQVTQRVTQSALTIGVVFIVVCTGIGIGNTMLLVVDDIESWFDRTIAADCLLRPNVPRLDLSPTESVPPAFDERIVKTPGIAAVDRFSFAKVKVNNEPTTLMARQFENYQSVPLDLREGKAEEVRRALLAGELVVGSVVAQRLGLGIGSEVTVEAGDVVRKLKVAGIASEYTAGGSIVLMDRSAAQKQFGTSNVHIYMVTSAPGKQHEVSRDLKALADEQGLIFESLGDFRESVRKMTAGVTSGLWLLLTLGMLVAAFGIVNTLTMNVLEQTHYLGLLRAIGMTRGQIGGIVVYQALMIGLSALIPGTIVGTLAAALVSASFRLLYGHAVQFRIEPIIVGGCFLVGLILVVLAALPPARRAANLSPLEAIHAE